MEKILAIIILISAWWYSKLIFVHHVARHGHRTSEQTYKGIAQEESLNFPDLNEITKDEEGMPLKSYF